MSDIKGCRLEEGRLLQFGSGRIVVDLHITKNRTQLNTNPFASYFFDREIEDWQKFAEGLEPSKEKK